MRRDTSNRVPTPVEVAPTQRVDVGVWRAVLALAAFLAVAPAHGQNKRDIRGFYPGMTIGQFDRNVEVLIYGPDEPNFFQRLWRTLPCREVRKGVASFSCYIKNEQFEFSFTSRLTSNVLYKVTYWFTSGAEPNDMIAQISTQFGIKPSSTRDTSSIPRMLDAAVGIPMARWYLGNNELELKGAVQYGLSLRDPSLEQRDIDAATANYKKENLNPKF